MALDILTQIILPVFLILAVGVIADRALQIDLSTVARLSFYVFISAVVFVQLVESSLDPAIFGAVTLFSLLHLGIMLALGWWVFGLRPFRQQRPLLTMGAIFFNSGNYGIPFAQLAFGSLGVSVMTVFLMVQLVANFTLGLWLVV